MSTYRPLPCAACEATRVREARERNLLAISEACPTCGHTKTASRWGYAAVVFLILMAAVGLGGVGGFLWYLAWEKENAVYGIYLGALCTLLPLRILWKALP